MPLCTRKMIQQRIGGAHSLRSYPSDSPRAKARLLALALLADGRLGQEELESLGRHSAFHALGISREDFFEVLFDLCSDFVRVPSGGGDYLLAPTTLDELFAEVRNPEGRRTLARLMFDVIRSDRHLAEGEQRLLWNALDAWKMRLEDIASLKPGHSHATLGPEHYYC